MELKDLTFIADYFIVCSGESTTQVKAIADHIEEVLRGKGIKPLRVEGVSFAHWILIDYGDVIVHIFDDETRAFYELEKFWLDAPRISYEEEGRPVTDAKAADILGGEDKRAVSH